MRSRLSSPAMVTSKLGMVMQTSDFRPWTSDLGRQTSDLTPRHSDQRDLNASLLQCSKIGFGHAAVGDHFLQSRWRRDQGQAAASELTGIADGHGLLGDLNHYAIDFRLQQVGSTQPVVNVETIYAEKQQIGAETAKRLLGDGTDQGK